MTRPKDSKHDERRSKDLDKAVSKVRAKEIEAKGQEGEAGRSIGYRIWQGRRENA